MEIEKPILNVIEVYKNPFAEEYVINAVIGKFHDYRYLPRIDEYIQLSSGIYRIVQVIHHPLTGDTTALCMFISGDKSISGSFVSNRVKV